MKDQSLRAPQRNQNEATTTTSAEKGISINPAPNNHGHSNPKSGPTEAIQTLFEFGDPALDECSDQDHQGLEPSKDSSTSDGGYGGDEQGFAGENEEGIENSDSYISPAAKEISEGNGAKRKESPLSCCYLNKSAFHCFLRGKLSLETVFATTIFQKASKIDSPSRGRESDPEPSGKAAKTASYLEVYASNKPPLPSFSPDLNLVRS